MTLSDELVTAIQVIAALLGAAYVVLAARRNHLCWPFGAASSAIMAVLSFQHDLPMQGWLNAYYVGMSLYGYWNWSRSLEQGELPVMTLPVPGHLIAAALIVPLAWFTAEILARETHAALPVLDSLTTWYSLFATWLAARGRIENWVYWIIIDAILVYLYYMQGLLIFALQFAAMTALALAGFVAWRRRYRAQRAPA